MALGEVIQKKSGGIEIEALFVDEGFGSLDQEALRVALETLQTDRGEKSHGRDNQSRYRITGAIAISITSCY